MYNLYASDFTSYQDINNQLKPLSSDSPSLVNDRDAIVEYIHQASGMIMSWCGRTFVPYVHSALKMRYALSPYGVQELPDDTLSVTSILDTADVEIDSDTYRLKDIYDGYNGSPYRYIEFSSAANFSYTSDFRPTFSVDGIFGYSNTTYEQSWLATTAVNDGSVTDSVGTITVTSAANINILDYIRIGTEFMQVTAKASNTLTVKRGVNGSTAAAHVTATAVDVWQIHEPIKLACTRLASWLYQSRQHELQSVQFQDGTVAGANYPTIVRSGLIRLIKPLYRSV